MTIRGVLFDVDGTLYDYEEAEEAGLQEHLAAEGLSDRFVSPAEALRVWREVREEEYPRFLSGELTFAAQKAVRIRRLLAQAGVVGALEWTDEAATAWFARYAVRRDAVRRAFGDALPTLGALAGRFRLGVVSNSVTTHQRAKLEAIGLLGYFTEPLVCSQEHGAAKPAPSIFLAGCEALGLAPADVVYVGDDYEKDAVGARDAGLQAVWLDRSASGGAATVDAGIRVIASLTELTQW
jgi:putative hydrolase of the HAD superfamily